MADDDPQGLGGLNIVVEPDPTQPLELGVSVNDDGTVAVDTNPQDEDAAEDEAFFDNLTEKMDSNELFKIADDLLEGIQADMQGRQKWIENRKLGIELLGFEIEKPTVDPGASLGESLSKVRHPLLASAVLHAQATAAAELLPAAGPVKVRNDSGAAAKDALAEAFERDFNHWLTTTASEYYPDTRRALFWSSFGGADFKKVYRCPIRRRPVIERVDANDLIVSDAESSLISAPRVTQRIRMRPSMMRRMQIADVYRNIDLTEPHVEKDQVEETTERIVGVEVNASARPEDQEYTVYECYCELELDQFAPAKFKDERVALPYRVTLEKDSRVVLEIRRNWDEDDEECLPKKFFVKYPYIEAMGLYGIGLLHLLGNTATELTAIWRIITDSGMINNFPGGLIDKSATRQSSNHIQIPVGALAPIDTGNRDIRSIAMAMPGKPIDPAFVQFAANVEAQGEKLGGTPESAVGEGKQDAPVGTTLALIEQATKIMAEVHKGLCAAQAEEFRLLKDRFREDPESFWRHNKTCTTAWDEQTFMQALDDCDIVPMADPNTPSHLHRIMKFMGLKQIGSSNPHMNQDEIDKEGLRVLGYEDTDRFFLPPQPASAQPSPEDIMAQATLITAQSKAKEIDQKPVLKMIDGQQKAQEIKSKERIEAMKVASTVAIHPETGPLVQSTIRSNTPQ